MNKMQPQLEVQNKSGFFLSRHVIKRHKKILYLQVEVTYLNPIIFCMLSLLLELMFALDGEIYWTFVVDTAILFYGKKSVCERLWGYVCEKTDMKQICFSQQSVESVLTCLLYLSYCSFFFTGRNKNNILIVSTNQPTSPLVSHVHRDTAAWLDQRHYHYDFL